jgi:hypothetical protein
MNQSVKEQWIQALTSGEYQQTTNYLQREGKYCCLGVLCELYQKAHPDQTEWCNALNPDDEMYFRVNTEDGPQRDTKMPPAVVCEWAGLDPSDNMFNNLVAVDTLAKRNDEGATFAEIAAYIQTNLE